jgi:hypothetical protein
MALTGEKVNKPVHKKCKPSGDRVRVCSKAGQAHVGIPETVRRHVHAIHEREIEAAQLAFAITSASEELGYVGRCRGDLFSQQAAE